MFGAYQSLKFLFIAPLLIVFPVLRQPDDLARRLVGAVGPLGIGIAWVINLFRVIRAVVLLGGLAAFVAYLNRR